MIFISPFWEEAIAVARRLTSGRSVRSRTALAMGRAALWCGIMSRRDILSASSGGESLRRLVPPGGAVAGIRPPVGAPLQLMAGRVRGGGAAHPSGPPRILPAV